MSSSLWLMAKKPDKTLHPTPQPAGDPTPPRTRITPFVVGSAVIVLLLGAYNALTRHSFTTNIGVCPHTFCDFVDYYYPMGEEIFRRELPVQGFLYSPFIAILLAVFPPIGLDASLVLWGILQILFVILYIFLFRRLVPAGLPVQLLFVALVFSSYPLVLNLLGGQVSLFIIVPLLGLLVLYERGRRAAGAHLLAFAVSFKFYPVIFIAPFATRRDIRFLLFAAAACGTILFVVPGFLLGFGDTLRFYGALIDSFRDSAWVTANPHSQFFPHLAHRLTGGAWFDAQTPLSFLYWISYGAAAANIGLIFLVQRARLRHACLWSFQLVFLTIPFVLKTSWPHDFAFLSFTQAFLARQLWEGEKTDPGIATAGKSSQAMAGLRVRIVVTFFLLLSIVLSNIVFFNLFDNFIAYGFCGFLFWANLLLLTASYVLLLPPALRQFRSPLLPVD